MGCAQPLGLLGKVDRIGPKLGRVRKIGLDLVIDFFVNSLTNLNLYPFCIANSMSLSSGMVKM